MPIFIYQSCIIFFWLFLIFWKAVSTIIIVFDKEPFHFILFSIIYLVSLFNYFFKAVLNTVPTVCVLTIVWASIVFLKVLHAKALCFNRHVYTKHTGLDTSASFQPKLTFALEVKWFSILSVKYNWFVSRSTFQCQFCIHISCFNFFSSFEKVSKLAHSFAESSLIIKGTG